MSEPLTDEEIKELRDYLSRCKVPAEMYTPYPAEWAERYARIFFNAMPRLLDEVQRLRPKPPSST